MKIQKIVSYILIGSFLLFFMCSKDHISIKIDNQQLICVWLPEVFYYSFLFAYDQGFELMENNSYYSVHSNYPNNGDTSSIPDTTSHWFLNERKDSITFTNEVAGGPSHFALENYPRTL
jgi:hypothetical protein